MMAVLQNNVRFAVLFLLLAVLSPLWAQVVVEPDVVTDSIDVFSGSEKSEKSRITASIATLVLPGLGHQYLGNDRRALAYFSSEALFLCGMIFSKRYSNRLFDDSKSYAWQYADARGGMQSEQYWQMVGAFMDSDEYNRVMELNRTPDDKFTAINEKWRWIDEYYKNEYSEMRETATRFGIASSFFLAAMVLNRVVSFVDIRTSTKYKGIQGKASIQFHPYYSLADNRIGIFLLHDL